MGMYDSVIIDCPYCGENLEFQSKAGLCELQAFSSRDVPPDIAEDLINTEQECKCGKILKLLTDKPITRIRMFLVET